MRALALRDHMIVATDPDLRATRNRQHDRLVCLVDQIYFIAGRHYSQEVGSGL